MTIKSNKTLEQLELIDLNGKILLNTNENILDISSYANGVYLVKGIFVDGTSQVKRLIKQ